MGSRNNNNLFGRNLRYLRKKYGETLEDVACAINKKGNNTISQWENGERFPKDQDVIEAIARHYNVTVNQILNVDLASCMGFAPPIESLVNAEKLADVILCTAFSEKAEKNEDFRIAYKLDKQLYEGAYVGKSEDEASNAFEKCMTHYDKAVENDIPEAMVNELRWLFFIEQMQVHGSMTLGAAELISTGNAELKDIMKESLTYGEENLSGAKNNDYEEKRDELKPFEDEVFNVIRKLKNHSEWRDYIEYYVALKYVMGLVFNDFSRPENTSFGMDLMLFYAQAGNDYAVNFIKAMNPILD